MNTIGTLRNHLRLSDMCQLLGDLSGPETSCRYNVGPSGSRICLPPDRDPCPLLAPPVQQPWLRHWKFRFFFSLWTTQICFCFILNLKSKFIFRVIPGSLGSPVRVTSFLSWGKFMFIDKVSSKFFI